MGSEVTVGLYLDRHGRQDSGPPLNDRKRQGSATNCSIRNASLRMTGNVKGGPLQDSETPMYSSLTASDSSTTSRGPCKFSAGTSHI